MTDTTPPLLARPPSDPNPSTGSAGGRVFFWTSKPAVARLDYGIDLTGLTPDDDAVVTFDVLGAFPNDVTLSAPDLSQPPLVILWIGGGTPGITYQIAFRLTTAAGRQDEVVALLTVVDPVAAAVQMAADAS